MKAPIGPIVEHIWVLFFVNCLYHFLVGTATQLVILPPHIPLKGQGGGALLLRYSMISVSVLAIFDLDGRIRRIH